MSAACKCRVTDLARLYVLCARIQALEPLKTAFRDYIGRTGLALVLDEEKVRRVTSAVSHVDAICKCMTAVFSYYHVGECSSACSTRNEQNACVGSLLCIMFLFCSD